MLIDPYKEVKKNVNIENFNLKIDKIVNEVISYLMEEYSVLIGTSGFDTKSKVMIEKIVREKVSKDYNFGNIDVEELVKIVLDKLFGYSILQKYIDDVTISDIRAIKWNSIYVMKSGRWIKVKETFSNETEFYNFVRYCVLKNNGKITYEQPMVVVSDKERYLRIEAGISPVNIISPSLVIRIHRPENDIELRDLYIEKNMMNEEIYIFLKKIVMSGCSILIAGKGGSGKTTLLRALIDEVPDNVSITSNEETAELYSKHGNMIQREIIKNRNTGNVLLEDLTRHSLVMSNDLIVLGELKGKEAMTFFDGVSTGHTGYATLHADSAELVIDRLITLMKKDYLAQQYTDKYLKDMLAQTVDIVIYMKDFKIQKISEIDFSYEKGMKYKTLFEFCPERTEKGMVIGRYNKQNDISDKIKKKMLIGWRAYEDINIFN